MRADNSTETTRASPETITQIPLSELHPFPDHPFSVRDDDSMRDTVESVKEHGVLVPIIVRPREEGGYEIVAGHRRKHACELAGLKTMPAIVKDIDRDTAIIVMVDTNLQREQILPSERAKAYKMKMDAIRRKAGRPSKDNSCQVGTDFRGVRSDEIVAASTDESARTVQRYIRLTELNPQLQQMVDEKKIAITPAVEISYLKPDEQELLLDTIDSEQATPSLSQAQLMKKLSQEGKLNDDTMLDIMMEQKKPDSWNVTLSGEKLKKYFPRTYTPIQIEATIYKMLDSWLQRRSQAHNKEPPKRKSTPER